MANQGYRLTKTGMWHYEFEECAPSAYCYRVEFVADKSLNKVKDYREFLEGLGIRSFTKNLNYNYSFGKVRLRYWGNSASLATSPGNINSELLIMEKKNDGTPFKVFTDISDNIAYFQKLRTGYLVPGLLFALLAFFGKPSLQNQTPEIYIRAAALLIGVWYIGLSARCELWLHKLKKDGKTHE